MLTQAIGNVLPMALGVALSPIPIVAIVLMLATPKARSDGPMFALGWVLGLAAVSAVVLLVAHGASDSDSGASDSVDSLQTALGILFIWMAFKQWRKRPKRGEEPELPKWMATIDKFGEGKAFGLGIVLSAANPKNLALTLAAAGSIAQAGLSGAQDA